MGMSLCSSPMDTGACPPDQPKLQAVLRGDSCRSKRGNAQVLAAGVRADDPLPVLLGIVEYHQRSEFRGSGGIPGNDRQGGE